MATVTKPIALDESLNTTELSSRNVADVLAQELSAVATAIGGIAVPSADHVSYDNSVSGLSATDVQNALDEIVSDIPTVNNGTLTIQQNGTSIGSFSANTASNVTANIKTPTADKKTATSEFSTANGGLLSKCQINLVPVQSGSGDPSPDNVRPISGHTEVDLQVKGLNLVDPNTFVQGLLNISTGNVDPNTAWITSDFIEVKTNKVSISGYKDGTEENFCVRFISYNADKQVTGYVSNINITSNTSWSRANISLTNDSKYIRITVGFENKTTTISDYFATNRIQLENGETVSNYEPYQGNLYQVQIGSTVYGGYVDLVSGVMTVDRAKYTITDVTASSTTRFYTYVADSLKANGYVISDKFDNSSSADTRVYLNVYGAVVFATTTEYASKNDFMTAYGGSIDVCAELATPLTIQLTPQQIEALVGENNLSTPLSGQSIETNGVEYREVFAFDDVEKVVSLRVPISMLGTDESGRTTASRAYTTGEFFYKDGKMYKVLTNIASGATFTEGTNISETTLFAELTALA